MDILDNQLTGSDNALTEKMRHWLIASAKWARFLSIVGFVMIGLLVIMLFSFGSIMSALTSQPGIPPAFAGLGSILIVPFALLIAFYFFPTLYLYQFSSNVLKGAVAYNAEQLETGFEKLKSFFKFIGIFTIVILSIYGLSLLTLLSR